MCSRIHTWEQEFRSEQLSWSVVVSVFVRRPSQFELTKCADITQCKLFFNLVALFKETYETKKAFLQHFNCDTFIALRLSSVKFQAESFNGFWGIFFRRGTSIYKRQGCLSKFSKETPKRYHIGCGSSQFYSLKVSSKIFIHRNNTGILKIMVKG